MRAKSGTAESDTKPTVGEARSAPETSSTTKSSIDVIAIAGKDGTAASQGQARQQIAKEFKNFNAAKAQCFKVEDRERLLAVIEAGFGDFKEFNELVRDVFKSRLEKSRLGTQELHSASGGLAAAKERYSKKEDDAKLLEAVDC